MKLNEMKKSPAELHLEKLNAELEKYTKLAEETNFKYQSIIDEIENILKSIHIVKGAI